MSGRLPRLWLLLLVVHLALTGALALANPHVHWLDDGFYTLTVARHLAAGQGFSYGGFPTNGVQPLYAFLMAPVMALFGAHPEACVKLALSLMALCSTALLYVLMRLAADLAGENAAAIAGVLYVANANLLRDSLSGLETPLHALLFWLFVILYLRRRDDGSPRALAGLGLLLGLTAYARFDTVVLFAAVAIDLAWRGRRDGRRTMPRATALFAPAALLLTPWFIWSRLACGSFFQSSGAFHRWRGLVRQDVPHSLAGMARFAAVKLISLAAKLPFEPWFGYENLVKPLAGRSRTQRGFLTDLLREKPLTVVAMFVAGAALIAALIWLGRRHGRRLAALRPLLFLWPALLGAALFYPLYLLNYSMRHFFPYSVGMAIAWGVFLAPVLENRRLAKPGVRPALGALLAIALAAPGIGAWLIDASPRHAWELTRQIERTIPAGEKIGYTDCGVFGYYLPRHVVVNLDGILNFAALDAMRSGDIGAYLEQRDVRYVLRLHNFTAEYAAQWDAFVAPRVETVPPTDWIYRLKTEL